MAARQRLRRLSAVIALTTLGMLLATGSPARSLPRSLTVKKYKVGLNFPVSMAWHEGRSTRVFYTEKATGKIRIIEDRKLLARACVDLNVDANGERGALGLELHPKFARNRYLYVYYTLRSPSENRVTRFKVVGNRCRFPHHIIRGIPSPSSIHQGGQLEFRHGKLFVAVGDGGSATAAQSLGSRLGKILRYNANGSIPKGNPFSTPGNRNPVWSYGHRNPFGLSHRPGTRQLYSSENGPHCDDEINIVKRGRNYGWGPGYDCGTSGVGSDPKGPLFRWATTIAPTDLTWYEGRLRALSGALYVGDFNSERLRRLNLRRGRVTAERPIYHSLRQITDVMKGPRGDLFFSTMVGVFRITRRR